MRRLSSTAYRALFFKHVFRFLGQVASPNEIMGPHCIAVSGGLDSMTLLWFAQQMRLQNKIGPIRAVFVHHHARSGQNDDAQIVSDFCQQNGIAYKILHAQDLSVEESNFENKARIKRRDLLLNDLEQGERLWLGHHLNDSYEWSMMQRNRSNSPKSTLGIPVRNGVIIRPFLCLTRGQIETIAAQERISHLEDPTNVDTKYDRNYLRWEVIPKIEKRYPKYLKHYVHLSNYLATIQHLNVTNRVGGSQIYVYEQGAVIQGHNFSQFQIQEIILAYSKSNRGEITSQIVKMLRAIDAGKKGPFQFSGGVSAYHTPELLMIYSRDVKNHDETVAAVLRGINDEELARMGSYSFKDLERAWNNLLMTSDAMLNMPGLILILENDSVGKTLNAFQNDSLFPAVSNEAKLRHFYLITCQKCLETWKRKKGKLPEKIRLLPLWTLTNLFPFQEFSAPV